MQDAGFDRLPLYQQVRDRLMERIRAGEWRGAQFMPNENDLAREYSVSSGTIRKALDLLEFQRVLVRKQGRGTSICGQIEHGTLSETATKTLASIGATLAGTKIRLTTGQTLDADGMRGLADGILDAAAWLERRTPAKVGRSREAA